MNKINIYKCTKCENKAIYNYINKEIPEYCKLCKLNNMYILFNYKNYYKCNMCKENIAEFNYENKKTGKFCINCKMDNMVYINNINQNMKKCVECNINEAKYNYKDINKNEYCEKCKKENMIKKNICLCKQNVAEYNYINERYSICCERCKDIEMIKTKEHKCELCQLYKTYKMYCDVCNKSKKTKEYDVLSYLRKNIKEYEIIYNETIGKECTDKNIYPDIRIDLYLYQLIIEVDEFQHRGANYKCDIQRMYDTVAKLGMPCVFIRYNPDNQNSSKKELLQTINNIINDYTNNIFDDYGLKVIYLYYK